MRDTKLRDAISRDLEPTRPLPTPLVRTMWVLPLAVAITAAVPLLNFFRSDLQALGIFRTWGYSLVEVVAGLAILSLALRESIPGRALSSRAITFTLAAGLLLPFGILGLTTGAHAIGPAAGQEWSDGLICFRTSSLAALPALVFAAILVARAFPLRPAIAGALCGLGAGVIANAGMRMYCEFSVPSHLIAAHDGAILVSVAAGAGLASVIEFLRRP